MIYLIFINRQIPKILQNIDFRGTRRKVFLPLHGVGAVLEAEVAGLAVASEHQDLAVF